VRSYPFDVCHITKQVILEHFIPPTVDTNIPWNTLNTYIAASNIPAGVTTMIPDKMSVVEVYILYNHILLLQDTPEAFKFTQIDNMADDQIIGSVPSPSYGLLASNMSMQANSPATGVVDDMLESLLPLSRDLLANKDIDFSTPANSVSTGVISHMAGPHLSPGCGLLANEDSNISKPSTDTVGDDVIPSVSDTNNSSSDAILKEPGTKSMKKHSRKDNEIPDGAPAKKQKKLKQVQYPPSDCFSNLFLPTSVVEPPRRPLDSQSGECYVAMLLDWTVLNHSLNHCTVTGCRLSRLVLWT
jgi:hypothetical protein